MATRGTIRVIYQDSLGRLIVEPDRSARDVFYSAIKANEAIEVRLIGKRRPGGRPYPKLKLVKP